MTNIDNLMMWVDFVEERHRIWERRQSGEPGPWTTDPWLANHKFTNVFRVLDYGSQYLMEELLDGPEQDVLMRCFLYRHTGRPEAWDAFLVDGMPCVGEWDYIRDTFKEYRGETVTKLKSRTGDRRYGGFAARTGQRRVFTGAYLVFPQSQTRGTDKIDAIVGLTERLFDPSSPDCLLPRWWRARTSSQRFEALQDNLGVGNFMAMQVLTDWGYSSFGGDYEDEFVVAGPGAVRGAKAIDPGRPAVDVIQHLHRLMLANPDCPVLGSRPPSWMDIQNTLCEFSKLVRFQDTGKVGRPYVAAHPGAQPQPITPTHWSI